MAVESAKIPVQEQFDRCASHYLHDSPMADRKLLDLITQSAEPQPSHHVLDVACGAGFLVCAFAPLVRRVVGVDLSASMLREAEKIAIDFGWANTDFYQADGETLPFADEVFDIVSCKLALHYFPHPARVIAEMKRVARRGGRIVMVDRVASEDGQKQEYHNRIEKLRTPTKKKVYAPSEIVGLMEGEGMAIELFHRYEQHEDVEEWLATTGAAEENRQRARELLLNSVEENLAGLKLFFDRERLMMTHDTAVFVASRMK